MALVPIILSGGAGTRLWPLSSSRSPKPLLRLPGDGEHEPTLLTRTFSRAAAIPGVTSLLAITRRDFHAGTKRAWSAVRGKPRPPIAYMLEPFGRNTAAAVALGALYVEATFGADAIMLVLPADHLIGDEALFVAAVENASALAREGWLATFGIAPAAPETGYGYLELGEALARPDAFRVRRFVEKPPLEEARRFVESGRYLWNAGVFCFTAGRAIEAFKRHAPTVLAGTEPVWKRLRRARSAGPMRIDATLFKAVPEISFDFAVMEKAERTAVVRCALDWSDVGSWRALAALAPADAEGNRGYGERVAIATRDTYVYAQSRRVATVGVEGLVIVETPDGILVASREHLQRVGEAAAALKARDPGAATRGLRKARRARR